MPNAAAAVSAHAATDLEQVAIAAAGAGSAEVGAPACRSTEVGR